MIEEKSLGCIGVGVEDDACGMDLAGTRGGIVRVHEICGAVFGGDTLISNGCPPEGGRYRDPPLKCRTGPGYV